jgi:Fe-S-cluster containining protein
VEDGDLLAEGLISIRQVYTLRRGEPVRFNIQGRPGLLDNELIKIKEEPEQGHCSFYLGSHRGCGIYDHRPLQCRFQECWNPEGLEKLWNRKKLTRHNLLEIDQDVMELLKIHDEQCDPELLNSVFTAYRKSGDPAVLEQVLDILRHDLAVRTLAVTRLKRHEEELDFLFGRPLTQIICVYGVRVEEDEEGVYHLVSDQ